MKLAKSLLLGSAAGLVAVAGAQAADLPVRAAAPVDYVRTCPNAPIGGTGFFVIPGTETCLQISGYVRAEYRFSEASDFRNGADFNRRTNNDVSFFARGSVAFDARTPTEYGTLRSFIRISIDNSNNSSSVGFNQAFIQFAGLTAGRIGSFFDFFTTNMLTAIGGSSDDTVEVLAYTATFGSGFSATVALEDGLARRGTLGGGTAYGGQELPNLVANLNVTQAWGSAQLSGALQQVRHNGVGVLPTTDDELGWAIAAGVNILLPMIAPGDALWLQATYADGAIGYVNVPTAGDDFAVPLNDATLVAGTLRNTEAWAVKAAFRHFWTPTFWQDIEGAYGQVDQARAVALVGNQPVAVAQDYDWWQAGTRLNWRPVRGLTFSADVRYTQIDTDRPYIVRVAAPVVVSDTASEWAGRIRIQRDF